MIKEDKGKETPIQHLLATVSPRHIPDSELDANLNRFHARLPALTTTVSKTDHAKK